jgi:hypothetical protein
VHVASRARQRSDKPAKTDVRLTFRAGPNKAQERGPTVSPQDQLAEHIRLYRKPIRIPEEAVGFRNIEAQSLPAYADDGAARSEATQRQLRR